MEAAVYTPHRSLKYYKTNKRCVKWNEYMINGCSVKLSVEALFVVGILSVYISIIISSFRPITKSSCEKCNYIYITIFLQLGQKLHFPLLLLIKNHISHTRNFHPHKPFNIYIFTVSSHFGFI